MLSMNNLGRIFLAGTCLFAIVVLTGPDASARPQYATAMSKQYPDLTKKHGKEGKLSCAVCHPTKNKKERNNYATALSKEVGEKNQKDEAKLKEALEKIEKVKSATEGKTFGDLIKDGELPGTDEVAS